MLGQDVLDGVFSINTEADVKQVLLYLETANPATTLVYGATLSALTTIRGLLDSGVPPTSIIWAHPEIEDSAKWCREDRAVHDRVLKALQVLEIKVYPSVVLSAIRENNGRLTGGVFTHTLEVGAPSGGSGRKLTIPCEMLLGCSEVDVDPAIFTSISKNSLVYDGRMVVDASFCTADPNVYAAGSFAKFSRRYGRTLQMQNFDSRELGQKLAEAVLLVIDPASAVAQGLDDNKGALPPPLGIAPKSQWGLLPGGLFYFQAEKPSLRPIKKPNVLLTSNQGRLSRLLFDEMDTLRSISYIGSTPVQATNLLKLVGMPSSYMNRVVYRYSQDEIPDLITFLQSTWATALYHESFQELRADVKLDMESNTDALQAVLEKFAEWREEAQPDPARMMSLVEELPQSIKEMVQIRLLKFLELHSNHLPGYVVPAVNAAQ